MPTHDRPEHPLMHVLRAGFATLDEIGEVSIVALPGDSEFEVQSDAWTLHLEGWPVTMAFIALDEEPVSLAERRAALDAALDSRQLSALRRTNDELENAIAVALEDSGDELSTLLARLLTVGVDEDPLGTFDP